jgi:long-subunit acyl-CoA synthetase (AMP-forming)
MILERINQVVHNNVAIEYIRTATTETITYGELIAHVKKLKNHLLENNINSVALYCDNTPQWIIIDLACQSANIVFTPIPVFFSSKQTQHLLTSVKPDLLLFDNNFTEYLSNEHCTYTSFSSSLNELKALKLNYNSAAEIPKETSKITFTSGSTGKPKGVCLSVENQLNVADALVDKIAINAPTHLSLLSFSTLLENVAGLYAPLLAGGTICIASSNVRGFNGAQLTDLKKLLSFISQSKPQTMILVPELLQVLLLAVSQGWHPPPELEFIAVGGSRVSTKLLNKAKQAGLPVYQGYGLLITMHEILSRFTLLN